MHDLQTKPSRGVCLRTHRSFWRSAGFTLLELMIVVAIIAILSAIAFPSYVSHVVKTHRVAAEGCLSEYSNYMERYYTSKLAYPAAGSSAAPPALVLDCATVSQTGNNYTYAPASGASSLTATTYTLEATPINAQATRDTKCGALKINQAGKRTISGTGTLAECW
jgi:type IV pilus assembly protein PilE